MASIEELLRRCSTDEAFRRQAEEELRGVMKKGRADPLELMRLAKKYGLKMSPAEISGWIALAREKGLI